MSQIRLEPEPKKSQSYDERLCSRCMGHRALCGVRPCPLVMRAKALANIDSAVDGLSLVGASPPSVFVGSFGYPKVIAGPLLPPTRGDQSALMERPDLWLEKSIDEILGIRFSLVRTKKVIPVDAAVDPPRILAETQTMALSDTPADSEATLLKRPQFNSVFSGRNLPIGPSAPLDAFRLEDNPTISIPVDKITSDTDMKAGPGILELYDEGVRQEHITRLLSVGVLGQEKKRRLVPTEWSITATDDIVGRSLHKQVLRFPWLNDYLVTFDYALGNTVIMLFLPSNWQFEGLECWLGGLNSKVITDHEWFKGRKDYAKSVAGAYYATRLPALEYLMKIRRQAGVIVFMEVDPQRWVPLGVWRFREIAKRAIQKNPMKFQTLGEALVEVNKHLRNPIENYLKVSRIYEEFTTQTRLTDF
ncbi:MAG: hypothetical protein RTU30_11750 [Candidatus Thorarchaeota archaeon]